MAILNQTVTCTIGIVLEEARPCVLSIDNVRLDTHSRVSMNIYSNPGLPKYHRILFAVKIKVHELRAKSKSELQNQLKELKAELALLRVAKVTCGAPNKLSKM